MFRAFIVLILIVLIITATNETTAQESGNPLSNFSTTFFVGSGDCASCHSALTDSAGVDVSFDTNWRASTMANASRDPLWQAKVASETLRTPALQGAIEEKCATCHMPMAHTQAVADGETVAIFGSGFLDPNHALHEAAMDGVSCALCHQIKADNLGDPSTFSGHFPIDKTTTKDRAIYGKYSDPSVVKMSGNFLAVLGTQIEDSGLCATCHTLYTTAVDENGDAVEGAGEFPEQTPYLEWEESVYGDGLGDDKSCQECHMPPISGTAPLSKRGSSPQRAGFGKHYFAAGNAFILSILRDNGAELGVTASTAQFNAAITRSQEVLSQETAVLSIQSASVIDGLLTADLRVENLTGHKFPTGIPIRRTWIHMNLAEIDGSVLLESGKPAANGKISGNDADQGGGSFEAHYDLINAGDQVQIYETIMGDDGDHVTYTLLRATEYLKDNRLLPLGFDKATAVEDVGVEGAAEFDQDFIGGQDDIRYQVPVSGDSGLVAVDARLLYQPLSAAFMEDLRLDAADGSHVARFAAYYDAADQTPALVAAASGTLQYELLASGWNMISIVVAPFEPALEDIFQPIAADLVLVNDGSGQIYWPELGINQIENWRMGDGYQVYMEQGAQLSVLGTLLVPETTAVDLYSGWNLIAYLRQSPLPVDQALASLGDKLLLVKDGLGQVYWPDYNVNQMGDMRPGQAYQLYMQEPQTFYYPAND